MDYVVATHRLEPQSIVSIRGRRRQTDLPKFIGQAFDELFHRLGPLEASPAGAPFVIYHEFGPGGVDAEVCVPVVQVVPAAGRIQYRVVPEMIVARTLHVGPYEELGAADAAVSEWIKVREFDAPGSFQERYLNGPGDDVAPSQYRTEIEMPVTSIPMGAPVQGRKESNDPEGSPPSVFDAISDVPSFDAISGRSIL